jgi:hypothetical protein
MNHWLVTFDIPYLLIGFGRWGTSDPQAGIPVNFGQISGAKVIVESALPETSSMLSQGSHFFHNITSFRVFYFSNRLGLAQEADRRAGNGAPPSCPAPLSSENQGRWDNRPGSDLP